MECQMRRFPYPLRGRNEKICCEGAISASVGGRPNLILPLPVWFDQVRPSADASADRAFATYFFVPATQGVGKTPHLTLHIGNVSSLRVQPMQNKALIDDLPVA